MGDNRNKLITRMHAVSEDVKKAIRHELALAINSQLVFCSRKSNHPDDAHNYLVLAYNAKQGNYTVICYNAQTDGLYWGHYSLSFKEAITLFAQDIWSA